MRSVSAVLACVAVGGLSVAVADPPAPAASTPSATTQGAPATPTNPPAATAAAATPVMAHVTITGTPQVNAQSDFMEKHFLAEGYKIEMHHGEKYFCRKEEELGSRLGGQKYCSTVEQLKATEQEAKASVDRSMMQQNNPKGN